MFDWCLVYFVIYIYVSHTDTPLLSVLFLQQNFWPIPSDCTQRILFFENKNLARLVLECLQYHSQLYPRLCIQDILVSGALDYDAPLAAAEAMVKV